MLIEENEAGKSCESNAHLENNDERRRRGHRTEVATPANKLLNISKQKNRQTKNERWRFCQAREGTGGSMRKFDWVGRMSRFDAPAAKILPLVREPGEGIASTHLYFQPLIVARN